MPRLDEYKTTRHEALRDLIDDLVPSVGESYSERVPSKLRMHIEVVIVNLYDAWGGDGATPAIRYLRGKDSEYTGHRLGHATLNEHVIPCLEAAGLVKTHCGQAGLGSARLVATTTLTKRFEAIGWHPSAVEVSDDFPEVRLRGLKEKRKERRKQSDGTYKTIHREKPGPLIRPNRVPHLAKAIEKRAAELKPINARYERTFVGLLVPDVELRNPKTWTDCDGRYRGEEARLAGPPDFTRNRLYLVYNNVIPDAAKESPEIGTRKLDQGGRTNGHWVQWLPEKMRRRLIIGNEPVVEIDFRNTEAALAYALKGLTLSDYHDDAYLPPDALPLGFTSKQQKRERNLRKSLSLKMFNSDTPQEALAAALDDDDCEADRNLRQLGPAGIHTRMKQIEEMHCPHIRIYGKKEGMQRMKLESDIAIGILAKLTKRDITCLDVHDSFIVPRSAMREAVSIICAEFKKHTGVEARIKIQRPLIPPALRHDPASADPKEYSEFFKQRALHAQKYGPIS